MKSSGRTCYKWSMRFVLPTWRPSLKSPHKFPQNTSNASCAYWKNWPHNKYMIASIIQISSTPAFGISFFGHPASIPTIRGLQHCTAFGRSSRRPIFCCFWGLERADFFLLFWLARKRAIATRTRLTERTKHSGVARGSGPVLES